MNKAILLDIEGTTTPIDFVHQTLFPFARKRIGDFVRNRFNEIGPVINQLETEYRLDFSNQIYGRRFDKNDAQTVVDYLRFLIDVDRKSTPLKSLQGKIWKAGYDSGELKSVVFEDVARAFTRWQSEDRRLAIYSSGSVLAQQLLFRFTSHGDLTRYISAYFDTLTGGKRDPESYRRIISSPDFPQVENPLFISDIVAELDAAKIAGFATLLSVREGNASVDERAQTHRVIRSFDEVE